MKEKKREKMKKQCECDSCQRFFNWINEKIEVKVGYSGNDNPELEFEGNDLENEDTIIVPKYLEEKPIEVKKKAYFGIICSKCGEEIDMTESYHLFLDRLETAIYRDLIKKLEKLKDKITPADLGMKDLHSAPVVHWSWIYSLIKEFKKNIKK